MQTDQLSPKFLRKCLSYDEKTGDLFWRERTPDMFPSDGRSAKHKCNLWNSRYAGKPAFSRCKTNGYVVGRILGHRIKAHRAIWAIVYDAWPDGVIDHINQNRSDNRLTNLRVIDASQNQRNMGIQRRNKSGAIGVRLKDGRWIAQIRCDNQEIHIGSFDTFEHAKIARKAAEKVLGFHKNHGSSQAWTAGVSGKEQG